MNVADLVRGAKSEQRQLIDAYVGAKRFGQSLPRLEGAALARYMPPELTEAQRNEIRKAVADEFEFDRKTVVYPEWIKFRCETLNKSISSVTDAVGKADAVDGFGEVRAQFEKAREQLWAEIDTAVLDGVPVPEVNEPVRAYAMNLLVGKVNVAHWAIIEREMIKIADDSIAAAKPEEGVKSLEAYPWVRAYPRVLDDRVSAIAAELRRQGIPEPATEAISLATHDYMCEAARLADRVDESRHDRRLLKRGRPAPDDSRFRKLLEAYRVALIKYGCTEANTKRLTEWISGKASELYEDLPRKTEDTYGTVTKTVKLGTTALNARVDALRGRLVARLKIEIAKNEKIRREIAEMLKRDPQAARDRVIAILTGARAAGESERAMARYELLTRINPELWNVIRNEISTKVDEFVKSGKCSEGIAWLQAYPRVRTYPEEIDEQYKSVCAAAVGMGVPEKRASEIIDRIAAATAEAKDLACYEDVEKKGVKPGVRIPAEKVEAYEKAVRRSRLVLVRNGCRIADADELIGRIHEAFSNETRRIESDVADPVLYLGANAINVRLEALKKNAALSMLSRYAAARLEAGDSEGARRTIRTIALTGDDDFDAEVYAIRLGVVNVLVNPYVLNERTPEIAKKVTAFCQAEDYVGLKGWIAHYPFVHDSSEDVARSLQEIRKRMLELKVDDKAATRYVDELDARIQKLIDEAKGGREPEIHYQDAAMLERDLAVFERALLQQYFDQSACRAIRASVAKKATGLVEKPHGSALTTRELNERLRAAMEETARKEILAVIDRRPKFRILPQPTEADAVRDVLIGAAQRGLVALAAGKKEKKEIVAEMSGGLGTDTVAWVMKLCDDINRGRDAVASDVVPSMEFAKLLDRLIERQKYLEYLASVDKTISYDSQITMAEDAIAKQLDAEPDETCLHVNALLGEYARAMRFLKQGQKLDGRLGAAMLVGSVFLDQQSVLESALELGVPVNAVSPLDPDRRTALLMAVQLGRGNLIHKVAARGGSVDGTDAAGNTVLHYAARRGNVAVLKAFVKRLDVNACNKAGETAIFEAARVDSAKGVEALLAAGAKVSDANSRGLSVMGVACEAGSCTVLEPLAAAGAGIGVEQLVTAVSAGQLGAVKWLVGKGVDVNGAGVMAASVGHPTVRDYLIHQGGIGKRVVEVEPVKVVGTNETANVRMNLVVESARVNAVSVVK